MFQWHEHPGTIVQIPSNIPLTGLLRHLRYPMIFLELVKLNIGVRQAKFLTVNGTIVVYNLDVYRYYDILYRGRTYPLEVVAT